MIRSVKNSPKRNPVLPPDCVHLDSWIMIFQTLVHLSDQRSFTQVSKILGFYENVVYFEPSQYDIQPQVGSFFILNTYLMDNLTEMRRLEVDYIWQCTDYTRISWFVHHQPQAISQVVILVYRSRLFIFCKNIFELLPFELLIIWTIDRLNYCSLQL